MNECSQEIPAKFQVMIAIGVLIIGFSAYGLTQLVGSYFKFGPGTSLFLAFRTAMVVVITPLFIPLIVYGEFINKEWKKRKFHWRNVGVAISISAPFFALTLLLLIVCDIFFSHLDIVWQLPLTSVCGLVGLISFGLTVKKYRKKLDF
jgi:hypothetical protein